MTQFYNIRVPAGAERVPLVFERPVRKITTNSSAISYLLLKFTDGTYSKPFTFPSNAVVNLDFQSANNGGGVQAVYLAPISDKDYYFSVSVIEYGTGGNIDWYK